MITPSQQQRTVGLAALKREQDQRAEQRTAETIPPPSDGGAVLVEITALANDYLTVKRVNNAGATFGAAFDVAKPRKLRHHEDWYPGITQLSTVNTNKVTVNSAAETWVIPDAQAYAVGDTLHVQFVPYTGVTVSSADLKWIDLNVDGRFWTKEHAS